MIKMILTLSVFLGISLAQVGTTAPDFTLDKLSGGSDSRSNYNGKVIYINWFGYSCPTCLSEGNDTQTKIADKYSPDVFKAMGIDVWDGSSSGVQNFKNSTGITYELLLKGGSTATAFGTQYQYSQVIDQNGVIQLNVRTNQIDQINSKIQELLSATATNRTSNHITRTFALKSNYPNPFNPTTRIPFSNDRQQHIRLAVYDVTGREVAVLADGIFAPGDFEFAWNGKSSGGAALASGIYFVRLIGSHDLKTRSVLLMK